MEGDHAMVICNLARQTLLEFGFEPMISVTLLTERSLSCVVTIAYDRCIEGEDEKAMACHRSLLEQLTEAGYHSYRLGIQSMDGMAGSSGYNQLLRGIKDICDPNQILAPGRYATSGISQSVLSPEEVAYR